MNGAARWLSLHGPDARLDPDAAWEKFRSNGSSFSAASRWQAPQDAHVAASFADLLSGPDPAAGMNTQILSGHALKILGECGDWYWIQAKDDSYVGWLRREAVTIGRFEPTHRVEASRTFLYPGPDLKNPRCGVRSMGSLVAVKDYAETRGTRYAILENGEAMIADHLCTMDRNAQDYVTVAETLLRTPYLWGGNTAFGIDCSGIIQLSMFMAGDKVLRDSDMQAATIGSRLDPGECYEGVRRGDLVFWKGHAAIVTGNREGRPWIIHANGKTMDVALEPLNEAVDRIAFLYDKPTSIRRPNKSG